MHGSDTCLKDVSVHRSRKMKSSSINCDTRFCQLETIDTASCARSAIHSFIPKAWLQSTARSFASPLPASPALSCGTAACYRSQIQVLRLLPHGRSPKVLPGRSPHRAQMTLTASSTIQCVAHCSAGLAAVCDQRMLHSAVFGAACSSCCMYSSC